MAEALPADLEAFVTDYFGVDVSAIPIHVGASRFTLGAGAHAAAWGKEIFLKQRLSSPVSPKEAGLVAHEIAHVLQHAAGHHLREDDPRSVGERLEQEAERHEQRVRSTYKPAPLLGSVSFSWGGEPSANQTLIEAEVLSQLEERLRQAAPGRHETIPHLEVDVALTPDMPVEQMIDRIVSKSLSAARAASGKAPVRGGAMPSAATAPVAGTVPQFKDDWGNGPTLSAGVFKLGGTKRNQTSSSEALDDHWKKADAKGALFLHQTFWVKNPIDSSTVAKKYLANAFVWKVHRQFNKILRDINSSVPELPEKKASASAPAPSAKPSRFNTNKLSPGLEARYRANRSYFWTARPDKRSDPTFTGQKGVKKEDFPSPTHPKPVKTKKLWPYEENATRAWMALDPWPWAGGLKPNQRKAFRQFVDAVESMQRKAKVGKTGMLDATSSQKYATYSEATRKKAAEDAAAAAATPVPYHIMTKYLPNGDYIEYRTDGTALEWNYGSDGTQVSKPPRPITEVEIRWMLRKKREADKAPPMEIPGLDPTPGGLELLPATPPGGKPWWELPWVKGGSLKKVEESGKRIEKALDSGMAEPYLALSKGDLQNASIQERAKIIIFLTYGVSKEEQKAKQIIVTLKTLESASDWVELHKRVGSKWSEVLDTVGYLRMRRVFDDLWHIKAPAYNLIHTFAPNELAVSMAAGAQLSALKKGNPDAFERTTDAMKENSLNARWPCVWISFATLKPIPFILFAGTGDGRFVVVDPFKGEKHYGVTPQAAIRELPLSQGVLYYSIGGSVIRQDFGEKSGAITDSIMMGVGVLGMLALLFPPTAAAGALMLQASAVYGAARAANAIVGQATKGYGLTDTELLIEVVDLVANACAVGTALAKTGLIKGVLTAMGLIADAGEIILSVKQLLDIIDKGGSADDVLKKLVSVAFSGTLIFVSNRGLRNELNEAFKGSGSKLRAVFTNHSKLKAAMADLKPHVKTKRTTTKPRPKKPAGHKPGPQAKEGHVPKGEGDVTPPGSKVTPVVPPTPPPVTPPKPPTAATIFKGDQAPYRGPPPEYAGSIGGMSYTTCKSQCQKESKRVGETLYSAADAPYDVMQKGGHFYLNKTSPEGVVDPWVQIVDPTPWQWFEPELHGPIFVGTREDLIKLFDHLASQPGVRIKPQFPQTGKGLWDQFYGNADVHYSGRNLNKPTGAKRAEYLYPDGKSELNPPSQEDLLAFLGGSKSGTSGSSFSAGGASIPILPKTLTSGLDTVKKAALIEHLKKMRRGQRVKMFNALGPRLKTVLNLPTDRMLKILQLSEPDLRQIGQLGDGHVGRLATLTKPQLGAILTMPTYQVKKFARLPQPALALFASLPVKMLKEVQKLPIEELRNLGKLTSPQLFSILSMPIIHVGKFARLSHSQLGALATLSPEGLKKIQHLPPADLQLLGNLSPAQLKQLEQLKVGEIMPAARKMKQGTSPKGAQVPGGKLNRKERARLARRNGKPNPRGGKQYVEKQADVVTVDRVVQLLEDGAQRARHQSISQQSNAMLDLMARKGEWRILAGWHQGGFGGKKNAADQTHHITIQVNGTTWHLRGNKGHTSLFEITGAGGIDPPSPHRPTEGHERPPTAGPPDAPGTPIKPKGS